MKKLLVGTVFAQDDDLQRRWFDLQQDFLQKTTEDYDHMTYLYGPSSGHMDARTTIIPASHNFTSSTAHVEGLKSLLAYFKFNKDEYEYFLFIDSDAFPIRKNWLDVLVNKMEDRHELAVVLRCENLETRWHASALFCKKQALKNLVFDYMPLFDLAGYFEKDVSLLKHQNDLRENVFPLIKTNRYSIHPMMCSVYYDIFYHHGCGSGREYNLRSRWYWDTMVPLECDVNALTEQLMSSPYEFVSRLAGWQPEEYAK